MLQEKHYYLSCLKDGPESHRRIAHRMAHRYKTSPAAVKEALLRDGLIVLQYSQKEGAMQKVNHYFALTDKKLVEEQLEQKPIKAEWEDGTPKSKGNAFDWRNTGRSMFNASEIARMTQKYHNNNPITIYSRA
jgi:hypothetical protein